MGKSFRKISTEEQLSIAKAASRRAQLANGNTNTNKTHKGSKDYNRKGLTKNIKFAGFDEDNDY